jgi:hypothetical protein
MCDALVVEDMEYNPLVQVFEQALVHNELFYRWGNLQSIAWCRLYVAMFGGTELP